MSKRRIWPRVLLLTQMLILSSCGAETLCATTGFQATPPPQLVVTGALAALPDGVRQSLADKPLMLSLVSADGLVLQSAEIWPEQDFRIALPPGQDQVNLRVVVMAGSYLVKTLIPEARAGTEVNVGTLGAAVTAHALLAERNAELERGRLSALPPQTLAAILRNAAASDDVDVQNFRAMISTVLAHSSGGDGVSAFAVAGSQAQAEALQAAGFDATAYQTLLDRAAQAVSVPLVCDPARLRVLMTCDISGQALDGNGVLQNIRQQPRDGKVFLGMTVDPSSPVSDVEGVLPTRLIPNDSRSQMFDDGTHGDELAGDKVYSLTLDLPRGIRVIYKYTNGAVGEGFTGTQEWPGNARILQVDDLLTGVPSGAPDCLVIRRDSFGDEASNKNFVNLNSQLSDGRLAFDRDLGGIELGAEVEDGAPAQAGLSLADVHSLPPLTPNGIAEARENGVCEICPAPLTVSADDDSPPRLLAAAFISTTALRAKFSEDLDLVSAANPAHYTLLDSEGLEQVIGSVALHGSSVDLLLSGVDFTKSYTLSVEDVRDASAQANLIEPGAHVTVGPDQTAPELLDLHASTITELNPAARPQDPSTGQLVVLNFSEVLDHISAENADNYQIVSDAGQPLTILAAYQRGLQVLLLTETQGRGISYHLQVHGPFDVAGNLMHQTQEDFTGLALYRVRFQALPGFAFLSEDGRQRGLPDGDQLYLSGTVCQVARAADGRDLRVYGRTDLAGLDGFAFVQTDELLEGQPVYRLDLFLPPGTYAWKLAHGRPESVIDPPATLESVSKSLATRNDDSGVLVNPINLIGRDGVSYSAARMSTTGLDSPGPAVLFKRENPDQRLQVVNSNIDLPALVIGAWRDRPFGNGADYDDGRLALPLWPADDDDQQGPKLLLADAPCSAGLLLSFDKKLAGSANDLEIEILDSDGLSLNSAVQYVGSPVLSTQIFVQTGEQFPGASYQVKIANVQDAQGHVSPEQRSSFIAPAAASVCEVVDTRPPELLEIEPLRPQLLRLRFSERLDVASIVASHFSISKVGGGEGPAVLAARLAGGGAEVLLDTEAQAIQAAYVLHLSDIADQAQPPNVMAESSLEFAGFGEHQPPQIQALWAVRPDLIALRFDEPVTSESASILANYSVEGLTLTALEFSASAELRQSAVYAAAPLAENLLLLHCAPQQAGQNYVLNLSGVEDLSGNVAQTSASFVGIGAPKLVDLRIEYLVSRSATVLGAGPGGSSGVPGRALSPLTLEQEREGVFIRGAALSDDGASPLPGHPVSVALAGFPPRGPEGVQAFAGPDPQLFDDATHGDRVAGDHVFSLLIHDVPLGSVVAYKAFASYSVAYRDSSGDPAALAADADPGPSQYDDGEEYPGNDNGARIIGDTDGDGLVVLRNLFGDEVSYKRRENQPVFVWVDDLNERTP